MARKKLLGMEVGIELILPIPGKIQLGGDRAESRGPITLTHRSLILPYKLELGWILRDNPQSRAIKDLQARRPEGLQILNSLNIGE